MFEEVRRLQQKELEILKELKRICIKNNIPYFLAFGTLIGAVRHKGFIPWDDDIDVCMKYGDYIRFEEACKRDLKEGFFLQTSRTEPDAALTYMKLRMDDTTLIIDRTADKDIHQGINIDIYPLYNVADGMMARRGQILFTAMHMLLESGEAPKNHGRVMELICQVILLLLRGNVRKRMEKFCGKQMIRYENISTRYKSPFFGNLSACSLRFLAEGFLKTLEVPFEDDIFSIPAGYDQFLTTVYGDYMSLPPVEEQGCKWNHIIKIDTENSYTIYKGQYYCVKR